MTHFSTSLGIRQFLFSWLFVVAGICFVSTSAQAQDKPYIKVDGAYVQALWQMGNHSRGFTVGQLDSPESRDFQSRVGIRRGRVNFKGGVGDLSAKMVIHMSENKITAHSVALTYKPSTLPGFFTEFGVSTARFGLELPYSTTAREVYERPAYLNDLFPGDTDLGLVFGYGTSSRKATGVDLTLGLMSGNGNFKMNKPTPNLLGKVELRQAIGKGQLKLGVSGYYGSVENLKGKYPRHYYGAHLSSLIPHNGGTINLRTEFIGGVQPGLRTDPYAYASKATAAAKDEILPRNFMAGMVSISEKLNQVPLEFVLRSYYYNRNLNYKKTLDETPERVGQAHIEGQSISALLGINYYFYNNKARLSTHYEYTHMQNGFDTNGNPTYWAGGLHMGLIGFQLVL